MNIAIVGTSHLTAEEKDRALIMIETIVTRARYDGDEIITGDADGIDSLVTNYFPFSKVPAFTVVKALTKKWNGQHGFKERNKQIAKLADYIYCISTKIKTIACYHCKNQNHERTGGCWTKQYAIDKLGKTGETIVI